MKLYKLTDRNNRTRNNTQWGKNVTYITRGDSESLCNGSWIHAYRDPYLALLMNPAHANFKHPHLWEADGTIGLEKADKVGCTSLRTICRIKKPRITVSMCRKFGLLCAIEVYPQWEKHDVDKTWITWARSSNETSRSAWAAEAAAEAAAEEEAAAAWAAEAVAGVAHITPDKLIELAHKACLGK